MLSNILLVAFTVIVLFVLGRFAWRVVREILLAQRESREYKQLRNTRDLPAKIDLWARDYVDRRPRARLVVGVVQRGRRWVRGYGGPDAPAEKAPAGRLLYEIGSVTKAFTGILLAHLEQEGVLRLDDPIGQFLPEGVAVPQAVAAITLKQLATHTAGLPRLPDNLDATVRDEANPYAHYTAQSLHDYLRGAKLERPPGGKSVYSNLGMGLLGYLLSLRAGEPFADLVQSRIAGPMGLQDTTLKMTPDQHDRLAAGHDPRSNPVPLWEFDVLAPAGGLYSTADDLLTFLQANLLPDESLLGRALTRAQKYHYTHWAGTYLGLGWHILKDLAAETPVHWHNGGTGGYVSFLAFARAHTAGVVLLSNYGDAWAGDDSLDRLGFRILRAAFKVDLE